MTERPDYPHTLPGPTGPLPRGWHRVTWRRTDFPPGIGLSHAVSSDVASVALLQVSLKADSNVVPDSITVTSWSDYPPDTRPEYQP